MIKHIIIIGFILINLVVCNSSIAQNKNIINGKLHGKYIEYNKDSIKLIDGYMSKGLKTGLWKYYKNNTLNKVEKYSNGDFKFTLDHEDYMYKEVYLSKINSYIPIPKRWETNTKFENPKMILTSVKSCTDEFDYCPNIMVNIDSLNTLSLKEYAEKNKTELETHIENFKVLSFENKKVMHKNLYVLKYSVLKQNINISGLMIFEKKENNVIIIGSSSEKSVINEYNLLFLETGYSITSAL
jgi:hypothetical protein